MTTTVAISMPGTAEWIVIALLALLIFGPERLPQMARNVGRTIARFKAEANSTMDELKRAADAEGLGDVASEIRGTSDKVRRLAVEQASPAEKPAPSGKVVAFDPDAT